MSAPVVDPPRLARSSQAETQPRRHQVRLLVVMLALVVLGGVASLAIGSRPLSPGTVLDVLFHDDGSEASTIVHALRVPRTVLALAVGIALGVAGALMQGHTRNPLADPGPARRRGRRVVRGRARDLRVRRRRPDRLRVVRDGGRRPRGGRRVRDRLDPRRPRPGLAGARRRRRERAASPPSRQAICVRDSDTLDAYRFWVVGSVAGRDMAVFWQVLPFLAARAAPRRGQHARAQPAPARRRRRRLAGHAPAAAEGASASAAVMLLTGAATAACGPIGFVGLVVPHLARRFGGVDYRWVVPYSGAARRACCVTVADIVGRVVVRPGELQVGIVMALIGGPGFIVLVRRTRMVRI